MTSTTERRPAASLSASLLARRSGAQPTMRRHVLGGFVSVTPGFDDLGLNDMDEKRASTDAIPAVLSLEASDPSPVARQIEMLAERMKGNHATAPEPLAPEASGKVNPEAKARKVAFTLRLDAERHLRLRFLSAMSNKSAQQFLVAALDRLVAEHDQTERLAGDVAAGRTGEVR